MTKEFPQPGDTAADRLIKAGTVLEEGEVFVDESYVATDDMFYSTLVNPNYEIYQGQVIAFITGSAKGSVNVIDDYYPVGENNNLYAKIYTVDKLANTPQNGDKFVILTMPGGSKLLGQAGQEINDTWNYLNQNYLPSGYADDTGYSYDRQTTGHKQDTARFNVSTSYALMGYIKGLVAGLLKPSWINQADATLSQSDPSQNSWYTILSTTNARVDSVVVRIASTETLEVEISIDGQTWYGGSSCTGGSDYSASRDCKPTWTSSGVTLTTYLPGFVMIGSVGQGRAVSIRARRTTNSTPTNTLTGRAVWSQFQPDYDYL